MLEVQNTMSKHAFYHANGKHLDELADIWVKEDGEFAETATFANPMMIMQGLPVIKKLYGTDNLEGQKERLKAMSEIYPEIDNMPENVGIGYEWVMHTQTTPIIEIAGDGKTAKGMWYSPGIGVQPRIKDAKVDVSGTLFMEAYGVDFVKEDDKWKMWHIQMFYDYVSPLPDSMTGMFNTGDDSGQEEVFVEAMERPEQGLPEGTVRNPVSYQSYSPKRKPVMLPRFPEPYYTFSETFSY
jgi:hypothetical protein